MSALRASVEAAKKGRARLDRARPAGGAGPDEAAPRRPRRRPQRRRRGEEHGRPRPRRQRRRSPPRRRRRRRPRPRRPPAKKAPAKKAAAKKTAAASRPESPASLRVASSPCAEPRPAKRPSPGCPMPTCAAGRRARCGPAARRGGRPASCSCGSRRATPDDAEPALFVHGLGGCGARTGPTSPALLRNRLAIEALDLPGHGRSGPALRRRLLRSTRHARIVDRLPRAVRPRAGAPGRQLDGRRGQRRSSPPQRPDLVRTLTLISPAVPDNRVRAFPLRNDPARLACWSCPALGEVAMRHYVQPLPVEARVAGTIALCFADPLAATRSERLQRGDRRGAGPRRHAVGRHGDAALDARPGAAPSSCSNRIGWATHAARSPPRRSCSGATTDRLVAPDLAPYVAAAIPDARLLVLENIGHIAMMEDPVPSARAHARPASRTRPRSASDRGDAMPRWARLRDHGGPVWQPGAVPARRRPGSAGVRRRARQTPRRGVRRRGAPPPRRWPPSARRARPPPGRRAARLRPPLRLAGLRAARPARGHGRRAAHRARNAPRQASTAAPAPGGRRPRYRRTVSPPVATGNITLKPDAARRATSTRRPSRPRRCRRARRTPRRATARSACSRAPAKVVGSGRLYRYSIEVENGITGVDLAAVRAPGRQTTLSDTRSWSGHGVALQRVDSGAIDFHVSLTSSMTVRKLAATTSRSRRPATRRPAAADAGQPGRLQRLALGARVDGLRGRPRRLPHLHDQPRGRARAGPPARAPVPARRPRPGHDAADVRAASPPTTGKMCGANPWPYPPGATGAPGAEQPDTAQNNEYGIEATEPPAPGLCAIELPGTLMGNAEPRRRGSAQQ